MTACNIAGRSLADRSPLRRPSLSWASRVVTVACALVALGATPSCTLFWLFNNDPEGLACDFEVDPENGACLAGFVCVEQSAGDFRCLRQGAKQLGEACVLTDECAVNLVCASGYESCAASDDINCALVAERDKQKACRPVCDIDDPASCGPDQLCFQDGDTQFCQEGVCASESDCQGAEAAFCVGEATLGGQTGFCFQACNPLRCDGTSCADCTGADDTIDEGANCVPLLDEILSPRTMCDAAGDIAPFASCGGANDRCALGSFCVTDSQGTYCAPWCRFPNAAPACPDAGSTCTQVGTGELGYCQLN